ncbi:hypothetical protein ACHHYP_20437 [Achlya hypogyna]|uniref:Uncharacterized protein n=1 Tax=Achlya hypogyna TaxID=1202772 RepID=A0A1V9YME7_ACHHY|nr:hypothetical protein ACHHYP_20437 [Achlya hypogyna]
MFLLYVFAELESRGWFLYATVGQTAGSEGAYTKDSWYFHYVSPTAMPLAIPLNEEEIKASRR